MHMELRPLQAAKAGAMTDETFSAGGSENTPSDGDNASSDDMVCPRRWADLLSRSGEWDVGSKAHAVPPKRLFL